jgi:AcrR family transcriptional regulator
MPSDHMSEQLLDLSWEEGAPISRRERERLRRKHDILSAAQKMVLEDGFGSFSMQSLAAATDYSPGAIYTYFDSKEDVLTALAIEAHRRKIALYGRVADFDARPRERMVALGEANVILFPDFYNIELFHFTECVRDRASRAHRERIRELDRIEYGYARAIVGDAVGCGDLMLPESMTVEDLVYTVSMQTVGVLGSLGVSLPLDELGVRDVVALQRRSGSILLDGFGWRPSSGEWDYRKTMRRIYGEVFPEVVIHQIRRF